MHYFSRSARIENIEGKLWMVITAEWNGRTLDVCKISEDGESYQRNIYCISYWGYFIGFPGEHEPRHLNGDGGFDWTLEEWHNETKYNGIFMCGDRPSETDKKILLEKYPKFKWALEKFSDKNGHEMNITQIFRILPNWKANALATESIMELFFFSIVCDKRWQTIKDKKATVKLLQQTKADNLNTAFGCRKYGCTPEKYESFLNTRKSVNYSHKVTFEEFERYGDDISTYVDYLQMANRASHDTKEDYWKWPKDLKAAHSKVMKECERIQKAEEAMERAAQKKAKLEAERKYLEAVKKFANKTLTTNGFKFFVPQTTKEFMIQAKKLNQCLITCGYMDKVAKRKGKYILVFMYKGNKPYATAELIKSGAKFKIGQFNTDQRQENDKATAEDRKNLIKWCKKYHLPIKTAA